MSCLECCIHIADASEKVINFSNTSWEKIKFCIDQWRTTNTPEKIKSEGLLCMVNSCEPPSNLGYHRKCYMKFTDKNRIAAAVKRCQGVENISSVNSIDSNDSGETNREIPSKHFLRSSENILSPSSNGCKNSKYMLPKTCIICGSNKYFKEKGSGKRKQEKLVQCETHTNLILTAATEKRDEAILVHIRNKDLIAIEMCYHNSCYKHYTRFLTTKRIELSACEKAQHTESFKVFCQEIIEKRIIEGREILRMTKVRDLFLKIVYDIEQIKLETYTNGNLKRRLENAYPQLRFIKQSQRNKCELVFCEFVNTEIGYNLNAQYDTSTESDDTDSGDMTDNHTSVPSNDLLRNLFFSSLSIKNAMESAPKMTSTWPPTDSNLTMDIAASMVPSQLFNFLAWSVGASDDPKLDEYVKVSEEMKRKLLSIAQDILYLASRGKKQTPKHLALAMTVRHITGSAKLTGILNGLGHCVSQSVVLQYDTALALQQINKTSLLPQGFETTKFTTLVWDNNDFGEETLSGAGTTHVTNGIVLQWGPENETFSEMPLCNVQTKGRKRTLDPPPVDIYQYKGRKKMGPNAFKVVDEIEEEYLFCFQTMYRNLDAAFYLSKLPAITDKALLPGWTGFNTILWKTTAIAPITKIGYLPILDANANDMSTINTLLIRSVKIADELKLQNIVLVMDQAIYAKAQQIRWHNKEFKERIVLRLGEFHICMSFLAIFGKRFQDAGLQDIFIESGLVSENSVTGVMSGHHYNRSVRAHKIMAEALQRLLWQAFLDQLEDKECGMVMDVAKYLNCSYMNGNFLTHLSDSHTNKVLEMYNDFIIQKSTGNPTFRFWCSYLEMVELLLLFLRATREGNWLLHLSAIASMLPWYFSYDRINYARYLPVYWTEMVNSKETHPTIHAEFMKGHFVVQRQQAYGFSMTACDQIIEQTINRDTKTRGGLTGITLNKAAVHRWVLSQHCRASIYSQCESMAGKENLVRNRKELDSSRIKIDSETINSVTETLSSFINPFSDQHEKLVNIVSGVILPDVAYKDVLEAYECGKKALKKFVDEQLNEESECDFFIPLKCLKLKTFAYTGKVVKTKLKSENLALKASRQLLVRLLLIAKIQNLNLKSIMAYNLSPVPTALSNYDGTIAKTNKATIIHFLEGYHLPIIKEIPTGSALLIDGMAVLQQLKHIPSTFGELARKIFEHLLQLSNDFNCKRIDFVTDRYPEISIKGGEHMRRSSSGVQLVKIASGNQPVPKQWKKFMSAGENKEALILFLYKTWIEYKPEDFENVTVFITHGDKCHSVSSFANRLNICDVEELYCDHEEADTRLLLHASHASQTHKNIVLKCDDTDVLVIAISLGYKIMANLYIVKGAIQNQTIFDISAFEKTLGRSVCEALISLHDFTGCDSVSCFKGKGKQSAVKLMLPSTEYIAAFIELGSSWTINDNLFNILEKFVCQLYGQSYCTNINTCRYNWLRFGCNSDVSLPPNKDSLHKHVLRANYQAAIHRRSLDRHISAPSPTDHGWKFENDALEVDWMSLQPIPDALMQHVHCKCKKTKCLTGQCSCRSSQIPCSELCMCIECENEGNIDEDDYFCTLDDLEDCVI